MEEYPEELRTPPVSLIALVGCPDHHSLISSHLHSEQPPINTLALPDFDKISLLFSSAANSDTNPKPPPESEGGILKRDWLLKHRTKVPSVVAALFYADHVSGDPAQWSQVCSHLDTLKTLLRPKNIKFLVIILHSSSFTDDLSEDRMIALRKRAELDSKYVVVFNPSDDLKLRQSLERLGSLFAELANLYYRDEGRRIKTRVEKKSFNSNELNVRYCFKVAVYAEFRRDWVEALRFYEDAYHTLREMVGTSNKLPPIQRLIQIKIVAEQLHFKISTLLLHGGKIVESVTWFRQHVSAYRKLVGAPDVIFLHWEWVSRQYLVFAELFETSSKTITNANQALGTTDKSLTEWEFQPAYYYQLAAHYLKEKANALELAMSMSQTTNEFDSNAESVIPSVYIGQFAQLIEQGDEFVLLPLNDEVFTHYSITEGKRFQDSFEIIALLKKSYESFTSLKARRMAALCGFQMGCEYFSVGDFGNAKELLDGIANLYRQEGWVTLLWEVLGYLRECSRKCSTMKEFVEYSLELAALPVSFDTGFQSFRCKDCGPAGPLSLSQREIIQRELFELFSGEVGLSSVDGNSKIKITPESPLHLEIDLVSPLRMVLLSSVAFHEPVIKPGASTLITVSLLSQLPLNIDIDQLEVQFNQSECNFIVVNSQRPTSAAILNGQHGRRVESASSLVLVSNKWLRLTYSVKSEQSGKLECIYIAVKMGPHLTICCRAESPASMDDLPLWKFEDRMETFPTKDPALAFSGQKIAQVEEPDPQVDLILGAVGPALVGECFVVPVTVTPKGHSVFSGELKINLVDVKGGGLFSPREVEPLDSHLVELLGVTSSEGEDESISNSDKIKKIQQSFGLISIPHLKNGESWSCKLEIKWHRPKPIMLFVSLGYFPDAIELTSQKVHVHKSLQIEGKTAVLITHQFVLPFRQDSLLLSRIKSNPDSNQLTTIPVNEKSMVIVSGKNCSEVPLQLHSMSVEADDDGIDKSCTWQQGGEDLSHPAHVIPGEEFKKVFSVIPQVQSSSLKLGSVCLRWRRGSRSEDESVSCATEAWVSTTHTLPDVQVELSPLVVRTECPPYAILGDPFTYSVKIQNQTQLLQEVKYSLGDAQGFVLSGSHTDTVFVLPKSEHVLYYKIVPLASGSQQLPRVTITSVRYSAAFQPSIPASAVFVFPSEPHLKKSAVERVCGSRVKNAPLSL